MDFDPAHELASLRQQTAIRRKRFFRRRASRLDHHTAELLALRRAGGTAAELQHWLRDHHKIRVVHSTVARWLSQHDTKTKAAS